MPALRSWPWRRFGQEWSAIEIASFWCGWAVIDSTRSLRKNVPKWVKIQLRTGQILSMTLYLLQQIHASEKDYELASSLLGVGVDYAHISNAQYTRVLFLLSRCMLLLIDKKLIEVSQLLSQAGHLVETWPGSQYQKEYLKVFYLILQVSIHTATTPMSLALLVKELAEVHWSIVIPNNYSIPICHDWSSTNIECLNFLGLSLFDGWSSKKCQALS